MQTNGVAPIGKSLALAMLLAWRKLIITLKNINTISWQNVLIGNHCLANSVFLMALTFGWRTVWLAATFCVHQHLAGSCFWREAFFWLVYFFWQPVFIHSYFRITTICIWTPLLNHYRSYRQISKIGEIDCPNPKWFTQLFQRFRTADQIYTLKLIL